MPKTTPKITKLNYNQPRSLISLILDTHKHHEENEAHQYTADHDNIDLPASSPHFPPRHGFLLPPESKGADEDADDGGDDEAGAEGDADDVEAEGLVWIHGVLEAEELGYYHAGHREGD